MKQLTAKTVDETKEFAREFIENLSLNEKGATVVCLYGDLGSGKTTFVKEVAKCLGVEQIVTSPTFVIEKIYDIEHASLKKMYHIDAYRLTEGGELLALGWEEMIKNKEHIIFIEWPKYVSDVLPQERHNITFTFVDDTTRTIDYV